MKVADRIFAWLLAVASLLHAAGSWAMYKDRHETLLWALSATLAGLLLASVNLLRAGRPRDRTLAWISFAGCLGWLALVVGFGRLIGNLFDFRVLIQGGIAVALALFSLRTALAAGAAILHAGKEA